MGTVAAQYRGLMMKGLGPWTRRLVLAAAAGAISAGQICWAEAPVAAISAPVQPPAGVPPRIPTADFAARAAIREPLLSPDGMHFVARATIQKQEVLVVFDLSGKDKPAVLGHPKDFETNWFRWAGNNTILFGVGTTVPWYGEEAYESRLISYDVTSAKFKFIGDEHEGLLGDDVLWVDPEGKRILLSYQKTIYDYPTVYNVDLATNHQTTVAPSRDDIWDWWADSDGVVRYGSGRSDGGYWQVVHRKTANDKFQVIAKGRETQKGVSEFSAAGIVPGSDDGYMNGTDTKTGRDTIVNYNFATGKWGDVVFEAPNGDIDDSTMSEDGKSLRAVWYTDDRPRVKWWDAEMAAFQDSLDKAVNAGNPGGDRMARVRSQSRDHSVKIVWLGASNDPGSYYLYLDATGKMSRMAKMNDKLNPAQLAKPSYVHYKARDGLDIPAYLTLPVGRVAKGLPLIIMPHGGPFWVRDDGTYDEDVQFLANRGYVVLQPEYRGSGSYGTAFHDAGKGQWGRAMQDDIDDGMDWLARQGIVDAKRVCLVGASYGGYAAMWGATRNPERYRCAASFAGVSDIGRQVKYSNHFDDNKHTRDDWRKTVQGDPAFDLKTVSPLYTVDRLKVPVLLVHGDKDKRVLPKQSRMYADALKGAGKTYEYVTLPDAAHGLPNSEDAKIWYDRLDAFLAKYNPAD